MVSLLGGLVSGYGKENRMLDVRDAILTVCSIAFGYALVPQVIYGFREKMDTVTIHTSAVTGSALFAVAGVYFSLRPWFAATACAVTGSLWLALLAQRLVYGPANAGVLRESVLHDCRRLVSSVSSAA